MLLLNRTTASLLLGTALLLVAAPAVAGSAIQPGNRPTPIPGGTNGNLPSSDLIGVAPGCLAARAAGPSIGLLLSMARGKGVALGTEQCYRSLSDQVTQQQAATTAGNPACAAPVATGPGGPIGTSMHGWGKAADFFDSGGTVAFGSAGFQFLQANAGHVGWNHPGWAQPGGSACPEAWHWEWVGDGGILGSTPIRADVVALLPTVDDQGYSTVTGLGAMVNRGDANDQGSAAAIALNWLVVAAARTPSGAGYWMAGLDGGVFSFGDAGFFGSTGSIRLNQPIVGMAATPDGGGYWLVAADGGIFTFGDARFFGSTGATPLNRAIVGMAATPDGGGYWLVAADGGIFTFGDARFFGSTGATPLNQPIVGMAATPDGGGYWLVAADGGIFTFGDAAFAGSVGGQPTVEPVVAVAATHSGRGYWTVGADGMVSSFGDARSLGPG